MGNANRVFKNRTPVQLSLIIAIGVVFINMCFFAILYSVGASVYTVALSLILIFAIVFTSVRYILGRFIYDRIKPIYKTIHTIDAGNNYSKADLKGDILGKVEAQVENYSRNKTIEIERLKELARFRREFLGDVSHELKTPVFNIQGYILTLLDGAIDDKDISLRYLKRAEKSIERIVAIVDNLEAISNLESGERELMIKPHDIIKLVEETFDIYQTQAQEKNITLSIKQPKHKHIMVNCDKQQIINLLSNLMSNAIKYGKTGGRIDVSFYDMFDKWLVEVKDDGIGIDPQYLPRIFERFYRIDKSRSRDEGGSGLGLAIAKHIIDAHKQTITVNSVPNKGTSFAFTLAKSN